MALSTLDYLWIVLIIIGVILIIIGIILAVVKSGIPWYVWTLIIVGFVLAALSLVFLLVF